jgi:hypothetical protein
MNLTEEHLEAILRRAPSPAPPGPVENELMKGFRASVANRASTRREKSERRPSGKARWLPVLFPILAAAGISTALVHQQAQIRSLEHVVREGKTTIESSAAPVVVPMPPVVDLPDERAEIVRLRELALQLGADVQVLEDLQFENEQLRRELASLQQRVAPELDGIKQARDRALFIRCVNNLKQVGLAARVWALDNGGEYPPDFQSISNELSSASVLVCPADQGRPEPSDWQSLNSGQVSYELLAPGPGSHEQDPFRVLARCPIHGHVGLCDGSVQAGVGLDQPQRLQWRDGKLYFTPDPAPTRSASPGATRTDETQP